MPWMPRGAEGKGSAWALAPGDGSNSYPQVEAIGCFPTDCFLNIQNFKRWGGGGGNQWMHQRQSRLNHGEGERGKGMFQSLLFTLKAAKNIRGLPYNEKIIVHATWLLCLNHWGRFPSPRGMAPWTGEQATSN